MANVEKLSIALTSEFTGEIREAIASGDYASASEVIRDALRTWKQARAARGIALDELRHLWRDGVESGKSSPLDTEDIKQRGRRRLAARRVQGS